MSTSTIDVSISAAVQVLRHARLRTTLDGTETPLDHAASRSQLQQIYAVTIARLRSIRQIDSHERHIRK
jgi:hypothetical protein